MLYKNKQWLLEQILENKTTQEIADQQGVTARTIRNWVNRYDLKHKIKKRQYFNSCDINFFQNIDNEYKAYILGFIVADGSITDDKAVDIVLKESDEEILLKIKNALALKTPIYSKKNNTQKRILICSKKLCNDLKKYGVVKNKTRTIPFPKFDNINLYKHFLRGCFDGDGYIGKRQCVFVTGSKGFAKGIISFIIKEFNFKPYYRVDERGNYSIQFNRKDILFINFLYCNSNIYLNRKYKMYESYWKI